MWSDNQTTHFVRDLKGKWGRHWHLLVPEIRSAIVDQAVLGIICGLDRETVSVAAIDKLRTNLHIGMGTKGD